MGKNANVGNMQLSSLNQKFSRAFGKQKAASLKSFARQYYAGDSHADTSNYALGQCYSRVLDAWALVQQRKSSTPKIQFKQYQSSADNQAKASTSILLLLDDKPFLVDSIRQHLNDAGVHVKSINNMVLFASRAARQKPQLGKLKKLSATRQPGYKSEALICLHCSQLSELQCESLETTIKDVLRHVVAAVKDFSSMCKKAEVIRQSLIDSSLSLPVSQAEVKESVHFIGWLLDNHFTFLGYEEYKVKTPKSGPVVELQQNTRLGISKFKSGLKARAKLASFPKGMSEQILKKQICGFAKSATRSKVHRPAYYDYVLIKEFDEKGKVAIEHRFVGLYTSTVYFREALDIPLVRKKVELVLKESGFAPNGHSYKDLLQVINAFPRDELFQISHTQLFSTAIQIIQIQQSPKTKIFVRKATSSKFFSCLVYVPKDIYQTKVRLKIEDFLRRELQAQDIEYSTYFSESVLARIHFICRVHNIENVHFNEKELEDRLGELIKTWDQHFSEELHRHHSESASRELFDVYATSFSASYKETYVANEAVKDIAQINQVISSRQLALEFSRRDIAQANSLSFKVFSYGQQLVLSDIAPILENMGLTVISESSFELEAEQCHKIWLHDFNLSGQYPDGEGAAEGIRQFEEAFLAVWQAKTDDDIFNSLVLSAAMPWRDVALLRAYAAYMKQLKLGYSQKFIAETLIQHKHIAELLIKYFYGLFDPSMEQSQSTRLNKRLVSKIVQLIDGVENLSEDSILRSYHSLITATLRTNYFQKNASDDHKEYLSFKLAPELIDGMPLPKPKFEIFVFSPVMEGVHLRGGKIARGGLRWSDRREDYRTEVLGLVKAQQVKNSVIVPVGAKGGFVIKRPAEEPGRDAFMQHGINCYRLFIQGLLDITDNYVDGEIVPPASVVRKDEDDPYLVVAADKGTATFSDIANGIASEYGFWLDDGFASGGSNGYDHKQMGITAKGAWVSVQRHFRELGVNVQKQDVSVVGIGDMSGDVFGNGMLLSRHICLVAAFNHLHIIIDPNPRSATSFKERQRLFRKPRSSWNDYNADLLSKGGGIFLRSAKSINISPEMKQRFDLQGDSLTPDELISALLKSPVDLLWNGGIGTYVKASTESHSDVGDKANDQVRINAGELRCKVVGEGGNLGLTQAARIEYGLSGGVSLTDFIDNSAGVDCSDHEVNFKILLNELVADKKLTAGKRGSVLEAMTDAVSNLVLGNNYNQVQAIGVAHSQVTLRANEYIGLIGYLEAKAGLDRTLEFLPYDDQWEERAAKSEQLTRPELSVLTSYMKMHLKSELVSADFLHDDYLLPYLYKAFPDKLPRSYFVYMEQHQLRSEIIATQLANVLVNLFGPSFFYRMEESTGATLCEIVKAVVIAKDLFRIEDYWQQIEALDYTVSADVQNKMMLQLMRLMRRITRWLIRNRRGELEFQRTVDLFSKAIDTTVKLLPNKLPAESRASWQVENEYYLDSGVPVELAEFISLTHYLPPVVGVIEVSFSHKVTCNKVLDIYYGVGEYLHLDWLAQLISNLKVDNYWQALARETFQDDLGWQQRALACNVIPFIDNNARVKAAINNWGAQYPEQIERLQDMLVQLQREGQSDYPMFSVVLRELLNLAHSTAHQK
jgi:glutamate dehydrogenase